jgi:IS605 OrfB family transposase
MIRQVELSLKFSNVEKRKVLSDFITECRRVLRIFVDILWEGDYAKFVSNDDISKVKELSNTWLSARALQCIGKQALGIVTGTIKKYRQRLYMKKKLDSEGKQHSLNDLTRPSKPNVGNIAIELDSRFVNIGDSGNSFDMWIKFSSLGNRLSSLIPVKKTKVFNKWNDKGTIKKGCRLTDNSVIVYFDCEQKANRSKRKIGVDIGLTSCITLSDGTQIKECPDGHSLKSIATSLSNKKKGSKRFKRKQTHRKNFINWSVNQIREIKAGILVIENLRNVRKGKRTSKMLSHFNYADILRKIELLCEEQNVSVVKVNPAYTSQRCFKCGDVKTKNRRGNRYQCNCGYTANADVNAAKNILASL